MIKVALLVLAATSAAGCVSAPPAESGICGQIAHFGNSSTDYSVHWVELSSPQKCVSGDYAPGAQLCNYLSSTNSPDLNRHGALECLIDTQAERYDGPDAPYPETMRYTARLAEYTAPRVLIRVEYPVDAKTPTALRISAQKIKIFRHT